jgi:hypothetical protein
VLIWAGPTLYSRTLKFATLKPPHFMYLRRGLGTSPINANLRKNKQSLFLRKLYLHQKALYSPPLRRGLGMSPQRGLGQSPKVLIF